MTDEQKKEIKLLREQGLGYKKISVKIGVSENTVKSFCKRNNLKHNAICQNTDQESHKDSDTHHCLYCGTPVKQNPGRKEKKFCSDKCRNKWWNEHLNKVNRKANYEITCTGCGKKFISYGNANRKYCCHDCYVKDRFGGICHG